MIITIDGPAGSGKSTVARKLANKLGFVHLNSGALYRGVGVLAEGRGISLDNEEELSRLAEETEFSFELVPAEKGGSERITRLLINGQDLSEELRSSHAGVLASRVGIFPRVRASLLRVQQRAALGNSIVIEGRDSGTVVFPNADVKFYLDADIGVRANRRFAELSHRKNALSMDEVKREMLEREERDLTRTQAPLRKAHDAVLVDSTRMNVDEVVELMRSVVEQRRKGVVSRD